MEMKKLNLILTAIIAFGLTNCSPKFKTQGKLKKINIENFISDSEENLVWHGQELRNNGNCYVWIDFFGTYKEKKKYFVLSDILRASPYAVFDSKSKRLYLKNRIVDNVTNGDIINYNPECK